LSNPKPRFLSLDVFRGATVCLMIIVNTSTGTGTDPFPWLVHARWIGFTAADWVFPTFLFVVGNSMSFGDPRAGGEGAFLRKTFKRTAILFLLGFLLYWFPFVHQGADGSWAAIPLGETRVTGVLQRIARFRGQQLPQGHRAIEQSGRLRGGDGDALGRNGQAVGFLSFDAFVGDEADGPLTVPLMQRNGAALRHEIEESDGGVAGRLVVAVALDRRGGRDDEASRRRTVGSRKRHHRRLAGLTGRR